MSEKTFTSSNFRHGLYQDGNLTITFNQGRKYVFYDVPEEKWNGLCEAMACGKYFDLNIKGQYEYNEIKSPSESGQG